ncbi:MAG: YhbY family RNA-binding protein [Candidimonas sp.]|nr:MAG: YhbY family RNA-binding protein [Candidimonas sp.]
MPKLTITSKERSALRAAAQALRPVVLIGDRGLSPAVLTEIDRNLQAHHLIKVKAAGAERTARAAMLDTICDTLSCAPVHHLGRTLIVYRPDAAAPSSLPAPTRAVRKPSEPYTPKKMAAAGATRTHTNRARKTRAAALASRNAQPARPAAARARPTIAASRSPAHNIPRRGSALTLKAGARRHLAGHRR